MNNSPTDSKAAEFANMNSNNSHNSSNSNTNGTSGNIYPTAPVFEENQNSRPIPPARPPPPFVEYHPHPSSSSSSSSSTSTGNASQQFDEKPPSYDYAFSPSSSASSSNPQQRPSYPVPPYDPSSTLTTTGVPTNPTPASTLGYPAPTGSNSFVPHSYSNQPNQPNQPNQQPYMTTVYQSDPQQPQQLQSQPLYPPPPQPPQFNAPYQHPPQMQPNQFQPNQFQQNQFQQQQPPLQPGQVPPSYSSASLPSYRPNHPNELFKRPLPIIPHSFEDTISNNNASRWSLPLAWERKLFVTTAECSNLPYLAPGKPASPYIKFTLPSLPGIAFKTTPVKETANPKYNLKQIIEFAIPVGLSPVPSLQMEFKHHRTLLSDQLLGNALVQGSFIEASEGFEVGPHSFLISTTSDLHRPRLPNNNNANNASNDPIVTLTWQVTRPLIADFEFTFKKSTNPTSGLPEYTVNSSGGAVAFSMKSIGPFHMEVRDYSNTLILKVTRFVVAAPDTNTHSPYSTIYGLDNKPIANISYSGVIPYDNTGRFGTLIKRVSSNFPGFQVDMKRHGNEQLVCRYNFAELGRKGNMSIRPYEDIPVQVVSTLMTCLFRFDINYPSRLLNTF